MVMYVKDLFVRNIIYLVDFYVKLYFFLDFIKVIKFKIKIVWKIFNLIFNEILLYSILEYEVR